jgi:ubiquinol-cytochrome c reductase cytochrome b subunit
MREQLRRELGKPLPPGVGWPQTLGSLLLFGLLVQVTTGILLALYYVPSVETAYESVLFIEDRVPMGSLIRGLHYWGASLVVLAALLHLLRTFLWGAFKPPRRLMWWSGLLMLLLIMGFGFTGYLLPWDLKAFFATRVGIGVAGKVPLVGGYLAAWLAGGGDVGPLTLTRFYALHILLLPAGLLALVAIHLFLLRRLGPTPPWSRVGQEPSGAEGERRPLDPEGVGEARGQPFYPHQVLRDMVVVTIVALLWVGLAWLRGAPLEARADPTNASYVPRPEWYFYPLYAIQTLFPGSLEVVGAVLLPGLAVLVLFLVPFLDRGPERRLAHRKGAVAAAAAGAVAFVVLTLSVALQRPHPMAEAPESAGSPAAEPEAAAVRPRPELVAEGQRLYEALRCDACHGEPVREEAPGIPPRLGLEGSRVRESWLVAYLREPHPMRYARQGVRATVRMPDHALTEAEARALAAFLMTRRDTTLVPPYPWTSTVPDSVVAAGERLFRDYACSGCHALAGEGSRVGPDLGDAGARLQPAYVAALLRDPKAVVPGTPMPGFRLWEEEIRALVAYLMSLR